MRLFEKISGTKPSPPIQENSLNEEKILHALSNVLDPDLGKDIVSLGFIKNLALSGEKVSFTLELTTPSCPVKETLKAQCESELRKILPEHFKIELELTANTRGGVTISTPEVNASLGKVKNLIAVASGKGGVAKSTTAVNVAFALSASGAKVGLLDADIYGPSVPVMTKTPTPTAFKDNLLMPAEVQGVKIISASMFSSANRATILRGPMAAQVVKQFLSQIYWGELDYLIIDYPPGTGDIQLTISQTAPLTAALIVTTPQEVALTDVRKAVSMFTTLKVPILGVIETMSYFICDGCDKEHHIFREGGGEKIATEFGVPLLAKIPLDPGIAIDCDIGKPTVTYRPEALVAKAYTQAAGLAAAEISKLHANDKSILQNFSLVWK